MWQNILLVGIGSMAGGIARYALTEGIRLWMPTLFPWGTFAVNMLGCLAIGMLSGWLASASFFLPHHRLLFIVGFCGSFTTFSTFSADNLHLIAARAYGMLAWNIGLSVGVGLLLTIIGYRITK